jgi:hypothetical protein
LAFVAKCRSLKFLSIDTSSWKTADFHPLARAPALEIVGFTRLGLALAEALSRANPKLLIGVTAANCYLQAGRRVTEADYLKRRQALNKKYGSWAFQRHSEPSVIITIVRPNELMQLTGPAFRHRTVWRR